MKRCPFCAEEIHEDAIKCKHCGSWLASPDVQGEEAPRDAPPPPPAGHPVPATGQKLIMPKEVPDDPLLVALVSGCCIAGLGQVMVGQTSKGLAVLAGSVALSVLSGGLAAMALWPLMGVDAYMVARRLKEGQPVGEWEFFPSS